MTNGGPVLDRLLVWPMKMVGDLDHDMKIGGPIWLTGLCSLLQQGHDRRYLSEHHEHRGIHLSSDRIVSLDLLFVWDL